MRQGLLDAAEEKQRRHIDGRMLIFRLWFSPGFSLKAETRSDRLSVAT
jgi:hypothetical protein